MHRRPVDPGFSPGTVTCPAQIGPGYVNAFQTNSGWGGKACWSEAARTAKPVQANGYFGVEEGNLRAWCSVAHPRKLRSIIKARQRRVCWVNLTHFDPVWPFEVTEIIEFTGPPGDLFIRRLKVRILHGPPEKPRGYGARRSPFFVRVARNERVSVEETASDCRIRRVAGSKRRKGR